MFQLKGDVHNCLPEKLAYPLAAMINDIALSVRTLRNYSSLSLNVLKDYPKSDILSSLGANLL